jgi:hypothetical protein
MTKAVVVASPNLDRNQMICSDLTVDGYVAFPVNTLQQLRDMIENGIHGYQPQLCIMSPLDNAADESVRAAREFRDRGLVVFWVSGQEAPEGVLRIPPTETNFRRKLQREVRRQAML